MEDTQGSYLSFAEIVQGRDTTVRVSYDGLIYAVDLIMAVTGKNCNDSNEVLRGLQPSVFDKEKLVVRTRSRLLTFDHAIELVMVLPGKKAKGIRSKFAEIIRQYLRGDKTMVKELKCNSDSASLAYVKSPVANHIGTKRGFKEINVGHDMEFVSRSFDLQEEALEMRHCQDISSLKNQNQNLVEMMAENAILSEENDKVEDLIGKLNIQINSVQLDLLGVTEELDNMYESLQILSEPHIKELERK
jgi:hypothetical protein